MKIAAICLSLSAMCLPSSAYAQSQMFIALLAMEHCVLEKGRSYAELDGSITEIADAALGSCDVEQNDLYSAYRDHYLSVGANIDDAARIARGMVESAVDDLRNKTMGAVAESRLNS